MEDMPMLMRISVKRNLMKGKEFNLAVYVFFDYRRDYMSMTASVYNEKERGFSVRCVKTEDESEE